jgi:hypothetical protein
VPANTVEFMAGEPGFTLVSYRLALYE